MERIFKNASQLKAALEEALSIPSDLGENITLLSHAQKEDLSFSDSKTGLVGIQFNISNTDYCLTVNLQISKEYIGMYSITSIYLTRANDGYYERIEYSFDDFVRVAARFKQAAKEIQAFLSDKIFQPEFDAPVMFFRFFAEPQIWQSYNGTYRQIYG